MESGPRDVNVYELVTELVRHTLRRNCPENGNFYMPPRDDVKIVKRLRSKAFEILLDKSNRVYDEGNRANLKADPLVQALKHAFVLKLSLRRISEAEELENLINDLFSQETNVETVVDPVLQLLIQLKNFQIATQPTLDIFHYGKTNPLLPEDVTCTNGVPMFQTYPMESFVLPEKFEAVLGICETYPKQDTSASFVSRVSFEDQHISKAIVGIETIRYNNAIAMAPCISNCSDNILKQYNMVTPFLTHLMVDIEETSKQYLSTQKFISDMTLPYEWVKPVENQKENVDLCAWSLDDSDCNLTNKAENIRDNNSIWEEIQPSDDCISKLRTWESLGIVESPKQMPFVTDLPETMLHLARIRQTSILLLLPKKTMASVPLIREVPLKKFLSDVKLLLVGVDSDSFVYDNVTEFKLEENITVPGISPGSLTIACREAVGWGNSIKSLSRLVASDPQTGRLQQDGLIFKAMCTNVKELLLYYQAALQNTFNQYAFHGLLSLLKKVRPLTRLIVEVARLCGCKQHGQCTLAAGSGILTHIYKEVTKVTDPNVVLVFYSILKSCCEVYFRFLQNWLFEGTCDDVYGEFMIQVRSQYLRKRGRKFWTEGFAIDVDSVPGFLSDLSESILQCGKTLRLLKICSPKNPVCNLSITAQPEVRVCLTELMLQEQLSSCQEYERKGEAALGLIVSLLSAIQDQKKAERKTAELVIRAQQETLSRINKQREELVVKTAQNKRALLQALKNQVEENALFKEKEKELQMLADKLLLEKINREQEEMRELQRAEREHLVSYYEKLASDLEMSRLRSNWRKARMNNFERRVELLESLKRRDRTMSESVGTPSSDDNVDLIDTDEPSKETPVSSTMEVSMEMSEGEFAADEDENSNFADSRATDATTDILNPASPASIASPSEVIVSTDTGASPADNPTSKQKDVTSNEESTVTDTQNVRLPRESPPLNYKIYKKNNERSNLQDFLRDEAMKDIRIIMNERTPNTAVLDARLNNILDVAGLTGKIIGTIDRPKSLAIDKIDNMTAAQANKLKVLLQEYGMTPNNNEFSTILAVQTERTNINDNSDGRVGGGGAAENVNNNVPPISLDVKLPERSANGFMRNYECSQGSNANDRARELVFRNVLPQQNVADTPMSCTTDHFTTQSTHTPLSQVPITDDLTSPNAGPETSCLSSNMERSVAEETCLDFSIDDYKPQRLNFGLSSVFRSQGSCLSPLTADDVEMIDHVSLHSYLEKSIIIPLQIQSRLVNNAVIKYLLDEHNMLLHLHSLRSYFFLLNGEFAKSLTDSLYARLYAIAAPNELFNSATLTNLLEQALMNSFSNNYVNSELLSLSAVNKPRQLYISDPNVLECLCLNYKISWPLNIIFDDTVMLQYSKVFKFLIMTGRMSWVLKEDFNIMKVDRNVVVSEQYHKLQLYRHSMTQFMNALHNYLTCSVLHASWSEFEKDLQNSRTIDEIHLSHMNYIKRILSRCMLNTRGEKMRVCLINIFKIILKFHNRLRSQIWTVGSTGRCSHPNFKSLEQMYQSFCEWRTYMAHVAHKLAISGYQPHLTHFLNALNMNHMYDLTTKQQRSCD
ncbi:gamma-tubulin complex component 6 isoform X2 [Harpegnathos saltator]|uniref:Gamma-tubulin complex component 6 n=1 Tax=Harpegnathos saltator TaxID=610380 RepID=E2BKJ1_HARSA|nr:gamma-tubulin complex component 6 isoform X2 [Harpegnathos saltator]EFN83778.1 Gamma-tubulin complex component 6 [Harpegnathos saltator]